MSSHVVVIDTTFRRANVKVNPGSYLSDVLDEACGKLNLKSSNYGFKHNNKVIDMSRTFRQSGLSSGAKLELVVASRSPSAVSVALQIPESIAGPSLAGGRLTDKFASNTTLWLILRAFESKGGANYNFTARGVAQTETGGSGAGRIYYETPVLNVMGRELSSFTDLQKTMAQLGINSGSSLIRLSFRKTETPLEEAMAEIGEYFKGVEEPTGSSTVSDLKAEPSNPNGPLSDAVVGEPTSESSTAMDIEPVAVHGQISTTAPSPLEAEAMVVGPDQRPMEVFAAPSGPALQAALQPVNEDDYEPTIAHAKLHQQRLQARSHNVRLPSDAETEAAAKEKAARQAAIRDVSIKVRFPDQLTTVSSFTHTETGLSLYDYVRGVIVAENEPFSLVYSGPKGPLTVPKSDTVRLIGTLGFSGRMLVNFHWDDAASPEARSKQTLKQQYAGKAQELKVKEIKENEERKVEDTRSSAVDEKGKGKEGGGRAKGGVPKWLKLPGKK